MFVGQCIRGIWLIFCVVVEILVWVEVGEVLMVRLTGFMGIWKGWVGDLLCEGVQ